MQSSAAPLYSDHDVDAKYQAYRSVCGSDPTTVVSVSKQRHEDAATSLGMLVGRHDKVTRIRLQQCRLNHLPLPRELQHNGPWFPLGRTLNNPERSPRLVE